MRDGQRRAPRAEAASARRKRPPSYQAVHAPVARSGATSQRRHRTAYPSASPCVAVADGTSWRLFGFNAAMRWRRVPATPRTAFARPAASQAATRTRRDSEAENLASIATLTCTPPPRTDGRPKGLADLSFLRPARCGRVQSQSMYEYGRRLAGGGSGNKSHHRSARSSEWAADSDWQTRQGGCSSAVHYERRRRQHAHVGTRMFSRHFSRAESEGGGGGGGGAHAHQ